MTLSTWKEERLRKFDEIRMILGLDDGNRRVVKTFLSSTIDDLIAVVEQECVPEEKHIFVSDGERHSCVSGCDGIVENCKDCRRDICSNKRCPLGKGKVYDSAERDAFNDCRSEILSRLQALKGK